METNSEQGFSNVDYKQDFSNSDCNQDCYRADSKTCYIKLCQYCQGYGYRPCIEFFNSYPFLSMDREPNICDHCYDKTTRCKCIMCNGTGKYNNVLCPDCSHCHKMTERQIDYQLDKFIQKGLCVTKYQRIIIHSKNRNI